MVFEDINLDSDNDQLEKPGFVSLGSDGRAAVDKSETIQRFVRSFIFNSKKDFEIYLVKFCCSGKSLHFAEGCSGVMELRSSAKAITNP